jgi:predicted kinase
VNPSKKKFVLIPVGLPGAGKTTLVRWLAERLQCRVVSRDAIRSAMFVPCDFTPEEKDAAFSALQTALEVNLKLGVSTLVDGMCFSAEGALETVEQIVRAGGGIPVAIYCDCPIDVAKERVENDRKARSHDALDRDATLVKAVADRFRSLPEGVFRVDMTESLEVVGASVRRHIEERLGAEDPCDHD